MTEYREFQDGELVPGTRYRVARLIGAGGMGRVYEVEHVELGKRFVLKALQRELARRDDLVARLRNEWRALARLEHPCIVNVTDAGTSDNGVPFYVMERLEGETLSALLHRRRRLLPQQALAIAAAILEGLHAAHQIGVVHRDVKPPNIFLVGPTTVKVLDFGIAKIKDANNVITARGMAVGTPRYMSPEQANGAPVDARSDIYATGLMLFEMVSGVGPFDDARDPNELLLAQLGRKAPLLSSICVVAPELDALVAGLLAKDPRERPADARQVAEQLRQLAQRYERSVATDVPTLSASPRPVVNRAEPPTRVEGQRRPSQPAPAATRPDGVAAAGRGQQSGDTTTVQPALELATTAVPQLPQPNVTQRLVGLAPDPATLYGPDTLVDRATSAPTAVPAPAAERTEMLLVVPPTPNGSAPVDPGVTRTAVPIGEAPNLTPPPVVPSLSLPPPRPGRISRSLPLAVAAAGVALLLTFAVLFRGLRGAPAVEHLAVAAKSPAPVASLAPAPRPVIAAQAAAPTAAPQAVVPVPSGREMQPPVALKNTEQKHGFKAPSASGKPKLAASGAAAPRPKTVVAMPASGL